MPGSNTGRRLDPKLARTRGRGNPAFAVPDTKRKNRTRIPSVAWVRNWLELGAAATLLLRFQILGAKTGFEYQAPPGTETGSSSGPRQPCFYDSRYWAQKQDSNTGRRLDPKLARARGRGNPAFAILDAKRQNITRIPSVAWARYWLGLGAAATLLLRFLAQKQDLNTKRRHDPKLAQARGRGDPVFAIPNTGRKTGIQIPSVA